MLMFDLFFGRAIPGRSDLTEGEWQDFLDGVVTVNLPNGYTVVDAVAAWMSPITHRTITEPSHVILVALPGSADSLAAINQIRTAYQTRFDQQLVGMTVTGVCGSS